MQALRNCSGTGSPAKVELNGQLYRQCPRAISLKSVAARYLVDLYFDCREGHTYPAPGGPLMQTYFTAQLFLFLDNAVAEARERERREQEQANKSRR